MHAYFSEISQLLIVKMSSNVEFPVFIETNVGTRFVIPISHHITAFSLKCEIERAHIDIFPELGFLSVHALMVKRNSHFYHLPDSFCLKHACQGFGNFWLLYAETTLLNKSEKTSLLGSTDSGYTASILRANNAESLLRKKRKTGRGLKLSFFDTLDHDNKGYDAQKVNVRGQVSDSCADSETRCESISEAMSVSSIISRYFTDFIDVGLVGSALTFGQNLREGQFGEKTCDDEIRVKKQGSTGPSILRSPLSEELTSVGPRTYEPSEIGKRLVTASNSLGRCQKSRGSSLSKGKRLWGPDDSSVVRNLVFEIDDND